MKLETLYPKLFAKLEDKDMQQRHLLNVDENYEDYDSEEFEFDFEEYNFIVYIAEPIQNVLGEEKMRLLSQKLGAHDAVDNFVVSEIDLYGLKSDLKEEALVSMILDMVEELA
jgi:hypothetical protein